MASILVTGGTGTLGRAVVDLLVARQHDVRVASRQARGPEATPYALQTVDYRTGRGLVEACAGVDAVILSTRSMRGEVDRQVVQAAKRAGGPHLIYISIVGVDRIPFGYYRMKLAAEREIENSGLPFTILRATQFHDLIRGLLARSARLPVMPVPRLRFQPVDVHDVAARLVELAEQAPTGRAPDFGGPEIRPLAELARLYLRATHRRRYTVQFGIPGQAYAAFRDGMHLAPEHAAGQLTFAEYLTGMAGPALPGR
ncbi:MAG TPA: NAD(P)H-binding protein [Mycobacteriales bacterium]|jgi:uncharacterized protein YbjT (DUF2867 family)|nr:NAD(P)H-binding protein [Mycobacteriales bacterium]